MKSEVFRRDNYDRSAGSVRNCIGCAAIVECVEEGYRFSAVATLLLVLWEGQEGLLD